MTDQQRQAVGHDDAGTGLAPGDLDDVLDDDATDEGGAAGTSDGAAGERGGGTDGGGGASDTTGGDRQRLADFARGFDAAEPAAEENPADDGSTATDDRSAEPRADDGAVPATPDGPTPGDAEGPDAPESEHGSSESGASGSRSPGDADRGGSDADDPGAGEAGGHGAGATADRPSLEPGEVYRIVDGKERRETAWTRFVSRTRELFTGSPAQEEERLDHDLEALRLRGLSQGVTLALGSIKGGAGKTTITLTLAEVLANALRVGVLVVDADLEFGTASDSVPDAARHGGTLMDVHRRRDEITTPGDLAPYLVTLPHGAQLLSGPTDPADIERIDTDTMAELMQLLRRFYPIILVDLPPGMGLRGSIPRWGFAEADDIVLVTTPKRANVKQMGHMLDYVSERHPEVPLTLAINMVPSRLDEAGQRVVGVAQSNGRSRRTAEIPEDPALSRQLDAGALDIAGLDQRTRIAVKDLTYALASQWCR